MIDKDKLRNTVEEAIMGTDLFLVGLKVSAANEIVVELDSMSTVDVDTCARIAREIESVFDRDVEDYELEVGSAGLTAPFTVREQYLKNVGNPVEVLTADGRKLAGTLKTVADDGTFTIGRMVKVKNEGDKRPHMEEIDDVLSPADCKYVKYLIDMK